jgi:hypothetical protein
VFHAFKLSVNVAFAVAKNVAKSDKNEKQHNNMSIIIYFHHLILKKHTANLKKLCHKIKSFFSLKINTLKKMTQKMTQEKKQNDTRHIKLPHNLPHEIFGGY